VVIDEAHHARKRRYANRADPTRLHDLSMELGIMTPHILLLTATPVQLRAVEAQDLLRILGLGGPWVQEQSFARYFEILAKDARERTTEEWAFALSLAAWIATRYLGRDELYRLVRSIFGESREGAEVLAALRDQSRFVTAAKQMARTAAVPLNRLLLALSPVQWFMVRNTRELLEEKVGFRFPQRDVQEEPVALDAEHEALLAELDQYLSRTYGQYEKLLSEENRGVIGFVRSIYHQRFVSSFAAAHETVRARRKFLQAVLDEDEEAMLRLAAKFLEESPEETDEDDLVDAMRELLAAAGARELILREAKALERLEERLRPYAPDRVTSRDPKMKKLVEVVDDLVRTGRSVLVFSKYTDTVDAIVNFVARWSTQVSRNVLGTYTGEGGKVFDSATEAWRKVSKQDIVRLLEEGRLRLLVCTDAASEGLNLQAASAVVNVDMPWNPAKVEQRIGRVDRLGQKAPLVLVRNVWYPDTIEAHMYRVLFDRKTLYQIVVGPAQEIISEGMRKAFDAGARGAQLRALVEETLRLVEQVKGQIRIAQGATLGAAWEGGPRWDAELLDGVVSFARMAAETLGLRTSIEDGRLVFHRGTTDLPEHLQRWNGASLEEGKPNALTPAHPIVQWLCGEIKEESGDGTLPEVESLYAVGDAEGLYELVAPNPEGGSAELVPARRIPEILQGLLRVAAERTR